MVRNVCCKKLDVKSGIWTGEDDTKRLAYACKHGTRKSGFGKCGKSCRIRWSNYIKQDLNQDGFTLQEEELIIRLHATIGSRWTIIAQQLPGRTDYEVKNYWNSKLRKKLTEMGIDPVTHRPFSQVLADYGTIGGLPKPTDRAASRLFTKPDPFQTLQAHSSDLLSELQAIKMAADASALVSQSSSSSSSSFSSSSSWRDFLLEDVILPSDNPKEPENVSELPMTLSPIEEASSFCHGSSFIEAMLDQDDKMFLDFRDLLEEPVYF